MDFIDLAKSRRSIRAFQPIDVTDEELMLLIQTAHAAPSGGNRQPWHFFLIRNRAVIARIIAESCQQSWLAAAPVLIVVCADIKRSEARYGSRGRNLYCIQDTAAAIQNILLCAQSMNLGACWCGAFDEAAMSALLELPQDIRPVAIIPVGHPEGESMATKRRPIEDIVTFVR